MKKLFLLTIILLLVLSSCSYQNNRTEELKNTVISSSTEEEAESTSTDDDSLISSDEKLEQDDQNDVQRIKVHSDNDGNIYEILIKMSRTETSSSKDLKYGFAVNGKEVLSPRFDSYDFYTLKGSKPYFLFLNTGADDSYVFMPGKYDAGDAMIYRSIKKLKDISYDSKDFYYIAAEKEQKGGGILTADFKTVIPMQYCNILYSEHSDTLFLSTETYDDPSVPDTYIITNFVHNNMRRVYGPFILSDSAHSSVTILDENNNTLVFRDGYIIGRKNDEIILLNETTLPY